MPKNPIKLRIFIFCMGSFLGFSHAIIAQNTNGLGLLKSATDAGYPRMNLAIEFPERNYLEFYTLNLEKVKSVKAKTLTDAVGKYVTFEYESEIHNSLYDLYLNGTLLNPDERPPVDPDAMRSVTGVLSNAAEVSKENVRGEIQITDKDGKMVKIPYFITPEIAAANGSIDGFRLIVNTGRIGMQEVPHLHAHIVGGSEPVGPMLKKQA